MRDTECVEFLQWCTPRLRMRWAGFRKVRRQVCKRIDRRMEELGLTGLDSYRSYLESHPPEWRVMDSLMRITISRFFRDRGVFDTLGGEILPSLAARAAAQGWEEVRALSAGCGSGEEPYSLQILWKLRVPGETRVEVPLRIIATDADENLLGRAREGIYRGSSVREVPEEFRREVFVSLGEFLVIKDEFKEDIEFIRQDVRDELPEGDFHLVLCRNLVLTYFEKPLQREVLNRLIKRLVPGGYLVVGVHESLPEGLRGLVPHGRVRGIYRRVEG